MYGGPLKINARLLPRSDPLLAAQARFSLYFILSPCFLIVFCDFFYRGDSILYVSLVLLASGQLCKSISETRERLRKKRNVASFPVYEGRRFVFAALKTKR